MTTEEDYTLQRELEEETMTLDSGEEERSRAREKTQHDGEEEIFGDKMKEKNNNELRLIHTNINGIPVSNEDEKNNLIYQAIAKTQADIVGLTEINRYWPKMKDKDRWRQRTFGWWETSKATIGYNTKDSVSTSFQPGGTMLLSIDKPVHRIIETGRDETGLGRWVWQRMKGKREIMLRIISAYRPCIPSTAGPSTTYSQHQRLFDMKKEKREPRQAFLEDLGKDIDKWHEEGDQIILMADFNTDTTGEEIRKWREQRQLNDIFISTYPHETIPATYHKGKHPIDTILVSHSIQATKAGFTTFGELPTDHRGLWIDITYQTAFGHNMQKLVKPRARRLKSNNPIVRKRWTTLYKTHIKTHNLDRKIFNLEQEIQIGVDMTEQQKEQYNEIMRQRHEGIQYADKGCRKLKMGGVPFSPDLKKAGQEIELWRGVLTKKLGAKYSMTKIRRLATQLGINEIFNYTIEETKEKSNEAKQKYMEVKKRAQETRRKFMTEQIYAIADETNGKVETIRKQIYEREQQRITARNVKYTLQRIQGGGITRVEVPRRDGTVDVITTKKEIEKECMIENEKKYCQTTNTPCMQGKLVEDLRYDALTEAGRKILDGTYECPPNTNQYTKEFIQQLQMIPYQYDRPPEAYVSQKLFKEGWKKIKEATSAGISGLHFGHMKTAAMDNGLADFESALSTIPYATGFSPPQWQYGIMVMLQKKAKVELVNQMRTIVLTEADFNFNNKVLGRMTLQMAEEAKAIPKEQYGSRKGHSAIDHAINKRLLYDILRQKRCPGVLCSNDAKSCFDRIIHSIAMLAYKRLGIPEPPVKSMLHTIQKMKHHVRTTFGDSEFTMSRDEMVEPYQGLLQGNGASPATWVIISAPLINMMREAQNGAFIVEPIRKKVHHTAGFAFVDDTDLIEADLREEGQNLEDVMKKMQSAVNRWEGGLKTTGGAIRPDKSWAYPIGFKFDKNGKWRYQKLEEIQHELMVKDDKDETQRLELIPPDRGKETLGVFLAPDGSNNEMVRELTEKATKWADLIRAGHLNRDDAKTATNTTIMKSLQYPLPALSLSKKQCRKIQNIVINAGLPKSGTCRNYPRAALFGPTEEGGLGLEDLYTYQGTSRIAILQEHINADTITGEMIRTSIEAAKIEIGVGRNIFELEFKKFGILLTECWIKDVWRYAEENNLTIYDEVTKDIEYEREGDVFLMEEIVHSNKFKRNELIKINICRLHLQVMLLSDIVDGYGENITNTITTQKDKVRKSPYGWPEQPRPGPTIRRWWRKAIKTCFLKESSHELTIHIGKWLRTKGEEQWQWFYNPQSQTIYQRHKDRWKIWKRSSKAGRLGKYPTFRFYTYGIQLPKEAKKATIIYEQNNTIKLTGWSESNADETQSETYDAVQQDECITDIYMEDETIETLKKALLSGDIRAVSDGSYRKEERYGTAGWILEDKRRQIQFTGSLITPGPKESQCSHRSELAGILGTILTINHTCKRHKISQGSIEIGCDGEGALKAITYNHKIVKTNRKHYDLIQAVNEAIETSPITWTFRHVRGHQDDIREYHDLNRWEQLNVKADILAKERMHEETYGKSEGDIYRIQYTTSQKCRVGWKDRQRREHSITSHLQKTLTTDIGSTLIRDYWIKKKKFTPYTERWIDWENMHKSSNGLKKNRKQWHSKWLTGFCGVGIMMQVYQSQYHTKCPRCLSDKESVNHVMQCPHPTAREIWQESLEKLKNWLIDNDAQPDMTKAIISSLRAWNEVKPYPTIRTNNTKLKEAIKQQDQIGWRQFMDGFISKQWRLCQKEHMERSKSQKSPDLWMAKLQRRIWTIPWDMWDSRNKHLHNEENSIHAQEGKDLEKNITIEMTRGMEGLPKRYQRLFKESTQFRMKESITQKKQWLTSVWAARDSIRIDGSLHSDGAAMPFYDKWKCRICPLNTNDEPNQKL